MTRHQKHPVLRKIATRRWRTAGVRSRLPHPEWVLEPPDLERARHPILPGERILTARETEVLYHVARGETDLRDRRLALPGGLKDRRLLCHDAQSRAATGTACWAACGCSAPV